MVSYNNIYEVNIDEFVGLVRLWPVLDALCEGPLDRRDLQERVDVSQPTIHRHVRALENAGLITKPNGEFRLTPLGEVAAAEFARSFDVMGTVSALSRVVGWLPTGTFGFDFARLRDADVTLPHPNDPLVPTREMLRRIHAADRIRMVTYTFLPEANLATRQCFVEASQSFEGVFDRSLVDTVRSDPASAAHLREVLADGARIAVAAEPVPFILAIADGTVVIGAVDDGGSPQGVITTDDDVVHAWAEETIDGYLERADQISPTGAGTRTVTADDAV